MEQLKEYIEKNYISRDVIEFIIHTAETTEYYTKDRIVEDLKFILEGETNENI